MPGELMRNVGGELVADAFYVLKVPLDEGSFQQERSHGWLGVGQELLDRSRYLLPIRLECFDEEDEDYHSCPLNPTHPTGWRNLRISADVLGGPAVNDFIFTDGHIAIGERLKTSIAKSDLQGAVPLPVNIVVNQSRVKDPRVWSLEYKSQILERQPVIRGAPDQCPFCGVKPLFCSMCGFEWPNCHKCGERVVVSAKHHGGIRDKRLIRRFELAWVHGDFIYNGSTWDGSDFVYGRANIVTHRALTWLHQVHAVPFLWKPVKVDVRGMTEKQMVLLEKARRIYGT